MEHLSVGRAVVDDEHVEARELDGLRSLPRGRRPPPESNREGERATSAGLTLGEDLPAHQLHQLLGNGESQASAAEAAGDGGVGLRERLEDPLEAVGSYPHPGVGYGEAH